MRFRNRAIIVLDQHYLINVDAIEHIDTVHDSLRRQQEPVCGGNSAADGPCSCRLQLLIVELSKSPKGSGLARVMLRRLAQFMHHSQHTYQANPDSPVSRLPADPFSGTNQAQPPFPANPDSGTVHPQPGQPPGPATQSPDADPAAAPAGASQPEERSDEPVAPAQPDNRDYEAGISRALHNPAYGEHVRPRPPPPAHGPPIPEDTCGPHSDLVACSIELAPDHMLYLPEGDEPTAAMQEAAQSLYSLLERLLRHAFAQGSTVSNLNIFFDDRSTTIAFNAGRSQLWFNAHHDPRSADRHARELFWFHTVCHELAHQYVSGHNSNFADVVGAITYKQSKPGRRYLQRTVYGDS